MTEGAKSLVLVHRHATGEWHGALRSWHAGPDGAARTDGVETLRSGHADAFHALREAASRWPDASVPPQRPTTGPRLAETDLPPGCEVTVVTPRTRPAGEPWVEVTAGTGELSCRVDVAALRLLASAGALALHSSSGNDHALAHRYDHYARP